MLYRLTKYILTRGLREFFSKITVVGAPVEQGAAVVVGNHPNLALDSLVISSCFRRSLWSLAKATLFKNPVCAAVLRALYVAPLYRKQDDPSQLARNSETFKEVSAILKSGNAVMLFPEGMSLGERVLQPIKTGAARMAFQAESESNFAANVVVQPVGITYADLGLFRSTVTVVFHEPIPVSRYRTVWETDHREAVRQLTEAVEEALRKVTVDVEDRRHVGLVEKIAWLYRAEGRGSDDFERFSIIARNVEAISKSDPKVREEVEGELKRFEDLCALFKVEREDPVSDRHRDGLSMVRSLQYFAAAPFVAFGILVFRLPYIWIDRIVRKRWFEPVYQASAKFFLGLCLLPLWAALIALLFLVFGLSWRLAGLLFLAQIMAGFVANRYIPELRALAVYSLWPGSNSPGKFIVQERSRLIARLEGLRVA